MSTTRIIVIIAVVAALAIWVLTSGWLDDRARPGTTGRVPVTAPADNQSP